MSLREILALTQKPVEQDRLFSASLIQMLISLVQQLATVCEEKQIDISAISAFDMRSNEWAIACVQVYENLL